MYNHKNTVFVMLIMFIFTGMLISADKALEFGVYNGIPVTNKNDILNDLNKLSGKKPIMELLLSEAFRPKGSVVAPNMGGHIAVSVNGTVYSTSSIYKSKTGNFAVVIPKEEYLYGTIDKSKKIPFGTGIGACYVRTVWGLRVFKLPVKYDLKKLADFWINGNIRSKKGDKYYDYKFRRRNCGTFTAYALQAAGFQNYVGAKHIFDFPRDIFTDFIQELIANSEEVEWELVRYEQVDNGKYWKSMYVPNFEWQRILKNLPILRHFFKKSPSLKKNKSFELYVDTDKNERNVKIRQFSTSSLLKKASKK